MSQRILVLANDSAIGRQHAQSLGADGHAVQFCEDLDAGVEALTGGGCDSVLVALPDSAPQASDILGRLHAAHPAIPVVVVSGNPDVAFAVEAMRSGAADYLREPCSPEELRSAFRRLVQSPSAVRHAAPPEHADQGAHPFEGMLGHCPAMREVFALIQRIAPSEATVLVTGESGTGKEMAVQAIHRLSRRRDHPFLGCDCTALAPTLLESELFGHVKGSFSGAIATKKGLFEVAHQGTLLLDEVANLSMETQGKLLRVLETRQVRKVGDTAEHGVDIRVIATTNRSLGEMVKVGAFRADLYYRLNVVPITLPPLRERRGDIVLLANAFLERFSRQMSLEMTGFTSEAERQMEHYGWPGNVRELRNIVERLAVLYGGTRIEVHHLPIEVREAHSTLPPSDVPRSWEEFKSMKRRVIDELEREFLLTALERCSQNITRAAESVGMQRPNFHALLRNHGIRPDTPKNR